MNTEYSPKASFNNNTLVFKLSGLWIPESLSETKKKFYIFYSVCFTIVVCYAYFLAQMFHLFTVTDNVEEFSESSFVFITIIAERVKAITIQFKHSRIKKLLDDLDGETFMPKTAEERKIIDKAMKGTKNIFKLFVGCFLTTVSLWCIFPLLDSKRKHSLPFKVWLPFSVDTNTSYIIIYVYEIIGNFSLATMNASFDSTIMSLMIHAIGQLDVLLHKLTNGYAGYVKSQQAEIIDDEEKNKMMFLKKCSIHYESITSYVAEVESIFNFCILIQFSMSTLIICETMFQMTVEEPFSVKFLSTFSYQCSMLFQLFFYCWYGNEITLKSTMIPHAAYFSDWCDKKKNYCRSLQIIMIHAMKPIQIRAGYFFALSVETFTTILRSAWSYFALLKQVNSEDSN